MKEIRSGPREEHGGAPPGSVRAVFSEYIRHPSFKRLLNAISTAQERDRLKSLAVLSYFPGEGKTFFVSVLALGYASFLRKRVLIMDTVSQTRNESFYMGTVLGAPEDDPMTTGPSGTIDLVTTRNLHGTVPTAAELHALGPDERVDDRIGYDTADFQIGPFLTGLSPSYDLILLDTCALTEVTKDHLDPIILAQQTDGSLLVTSDASMDRAVVQRVASDLSRAGVKIAGTVFNSGPPV
jgi:Mrp family chromosome partitioning ATPase